MKKVIISFLALLLAAFGGTQIATQLGGSPGNLPSTMATSSSVEISELSPQVLFPASPIARSCSFRVITTATAPIYIQFDNTATASLQNQIGYYQAGSTTIAYPAENYGCEDWIVSQAEEVVTASTTISITEFR